MIIESIEWCLTPASSAARKSGLLSEQIAIRHRARRCRKLWKSHLANTKAAILRKAPEAFQQEAVILGSGHLNDIDLGGLLTRFQKVVLVDVLHPIEIRLRAALSHGRIELLTLDAGGVLEAAVQGKTPLVIGPPALLQDRVEAADFVASVNLMSQLMISPAHMWRKKGMTDVELYAIGRAVVEAHFTLVKSATCGVLITDCAGRHVSDAAIGEWQGLLYGTVLPTPEAEWIWQIASAKESGDGLREERRVVSIRT